jgi:hypothetical protein
MPVVFGGDRKSRDHRTGARGWRAATFAPVLAPVLAAVLAAIAGTAGTIGPAAAADLRLAGERLTVQIDPKVDRSAPFDGASPRQVGLESMLRARTATAGPDVAVEVGHYGAARAGGGAVRAGGRSYELSQRLGISGRLSNVLNLSSRKLAADITGGYSVGDMARLGGGKLETTVTVHASPVDRLSTHSEFGWWGQRPADGDRAWTQGGHGRLGLSYTLPGLGRIGAFERLGVSGPRGQARSYESGIELDFGPHTFSLSQRLETVGRALAGPSATAAAYGWQVGPLAMAFSADYTASSETAPATGFAGLAVTLGIAGPGPGALLDALR